MALSSLLKVISYFPPFYWLEFVKVDVGVRRLSLLLLVCCSPKVLVFTQKVAKEGISFCFFCKNIVWTIWSWNYVQKIVYLSKSRIFVSVISSVSLSSWFRVFCFLLFLGRLLRQRKFHKIDYDFELNDIYFILLGCKR